MNTEETSKNIFRYIKRLLLSKCKLKFVAMKEKFVHQPLTQPTLTWSKLTIETLEQGVRYAQS